MFPLWRHCGGGEGTSHSGRSAGLYFRFPGLILCFHAGNGYKKHPVGLLEDIHQEFYRRGTTWSCVYVLLIMSLWGRHDRSKGRCFMLKM